MQILVDPNNVTPNLPEEDRATVAALVHELLSSGHNAKLGHAVMLLAWQLYQVGYVMTRSALSPAAEALGAEDDKLFQGLLASATTGAFVQFDTQDVEERLRQICLPVLRRINAGSAPKGPAIPLESRDDFALRNDRVYMVLCPSRPALARALRGYVVEPSAMAPDACVLEIPAAGTPPFGGFGPRGAFLDTHFHTALFSDNRWRDCARALTQFAPVGKYPSLVVVHDMPTDALGDPVRMQAYMRRLSRAQEILRCPIVVGCVGSIEALSQVNAAATTVLLQSHPVRALATEYRKDEQGVVWTCRLEDGWAQFEIAELTPAPSTEQKADENVNDDDGTARVGHGSEQHGRAVSGVVGETESGDVGATDADADGTAEGSSDAAATDREETPGGD